MGSNYSYSICIDVLFIYVDSLKVKYFRFTETSSDFKCVKQCVMAVTSLLPQLRLDASAGSARGKARVDILHFDVVIVLSGSVRLTKLEDAREENICRLESN